METKDRAREFCEGAFGPFGVNVEPYVETIEELLRGEADDERARIADVLDEVVGSLRRQDSDTINTDYIQFAEQLARILRVPREGLLSIALKELADEAMAGTR